MSGNANVADLTIFIGASGSGKTLLGKGELRAYAKPFMVWSWKELLDHYAPEFGEHVAGDPGGLAELVEAGESVVYVPSRKSDDLVAKQFDFFCQLALDVGDRVVFVEEMAIVADARRAPARWKQIVTEGRGLGLVPMAATQRPTLCDSTIMDAATRIYCGRLNKASSQKAMADCMGGLDLARIRGLKPLQFLRWEAGGETVELVNVKPPKRKKR